LSLVVVVQRHMLVAVLAVCFKAYCLLPQEHPLLQLLAREVQAHLLLEEILFLVLLLLLAVDVTIAKMAVLGLVETEALFRILLVLVDKVLLDKEMQVDLGEMLVQMFMVAVAVAQGQSD
jgi:hypothetical protein